MVEYFTFCRFSEYNKLRARHVRKVGNNVEMVFPSSRNDQNARGTKLVMAANGTTFCPVKLCELYRYYKRFNYKMGMESGHTSLLHARIRKRGVVHMVGEWQPAAGGRGRSYSICWEDGQVISDKSSKTLRMARTLKEGAVAKDIALHDRWRSLDTFVLKRQLPSEQRPKYRIKRTHFFTDRNGTDTSTHHLTQRNCIKNKK